jgi:hypothetical protein
MNQRDFNDLRTTYDRTPSWWTNDRVWYLLGLLVACLGLIVVSCWPAEAHADWFGIGTAVAAGAEATWKIALIEAVKHSLPMLLLGITVVGAIVSAWGAGALALRMLELAREALRDDKVTVSEWIVLGAGALIAVPVAIGLMWFAYFLAMASRSGLLELMK